MITVRLSEAEALDAITALGEAGHNGIALKLSRELEEQVNELLNAATQAFFSALHDELMGTTGDLSPEASFAFEKAAREAVREYVRVNAR